MTYIVGGTQQFTHSELDSDGNAIPQEAGRWTVSNPAVASITQSGLASWLAPGETEIIFVIQSARKAGAFHVVVLGAAPASLAALPSSVSVPAGEVESLQITALDAGSNPITDFSLDSATSDDTSVADVVIVGADALLVIGKVAGSCHVTVVSGSATLVIDVAVLMAAGGAVDSVFGRIGAVVAVSGDYDVSEVTGAATAASVTSEATSRASADTALQANIDAEASARVLADSAEGLARAGADTSLASAIAAEATTRAGADTTEAAARSAADTSEATARANADSAETSARVAADAAESAARASADALLAPLASPALSGHPTGVTEAPADNSTRLATTAYADAAVAVAVASGSGSVAAEAATRAAADALLAPLASPALSGLPTAPTQVALDNSTKIATTAYTDAAVGVEATARSAAIVAAVAALVNSSPALLDTLKELADAIGDDPNFAATMTAALALKAPLASPALSGAPTAPTAAALDNTTKIATTAYADAAVAVEAAARVSADTTESAARIAADAVKAPLASPALSGHPTGVTELPLDNSTRLASTAYADAAVAVEAARAAAAEALKAPLASPTLSGIPAAPTAAPGTNTTQIATTAFVEAAVGGGGAVSSVFGRTGAVVKASGDYAVADVTGAAPLASPALTGHPTGVTETPGDNSTRLASTAYADAAVAVEASARSSADALKAPLASPALSGHPTGVTEAALDNSTRLATTAYADAAVAVEAAARASAVSAEASARTAADALLAPLASPVFSGNPTVPTQSAGNNTTRAASTAFVAAALSGTTVGTVARASVNYTTASLANGAVENGTITIPLGSFEAMLQSITTDHTVWIRIYSTAAARTADASRNINKDPAPGVGVLADFLVNGTTVAASPPVFLYNNDGTPASTLYLSITNKSGGTATTAISFVLRPL